MTKKHHPKDRLERKQLEELHKVTPKHERVISKQVLIEEEMEHGFREYLEESEA